MSPIRNACDTNIYYEAYGKGETVLYLQSVLGGINPGAYYFAGRISKKHRVIIWDGPNCGQSGVVIKDTQSEYHLACEYIKGLLDELGEKSVHIAGCSGGGEMGLLFAGLYPDRVKSLAMYRPTDTSCEIERAIVEARYYDLARAADISMENAVKYSENPSEGRFKNVSRWLAELCRRDSEKILGINGSDFARIMRRWGDQMSSPDFYRGHMSDEELGKINIPVLICTCPDDYHPQRLGDDLHRALPGSMLVSAGEYRRENEIYNEAEDENLFGGFTGFIDCYEDFINEKASR